MSKNRNKKNKYELFKEELEKHKYIITKKEKYTTYGYKKWLYTFYHIKGNCVIGGFCTAHDPNEIEASYCYLNGKICVDHKNCFDKWAKCPICIEIPVGKDQTEYVINMLKYLGTDEGYNKSNCYEFDGVYSYNAIC